MIPVFMGESWPVILMPIHVVFLELIIDPACSVIFEAENAEPNVMNRPPRNPKERLFNIRSLFLSIVQGFSVLAFVLGVFVIARRDGLTDNDSRALAFVTLVISNICLILTNRSWTRTIFSMFKEPNSALWWVVSGATIFLGLALGVPFLRNLFHFDIFHLRDWILCLIAGIGSILWFEILKVIFAKTR
jgi:Ca2+-transporting ATPase